MDELSNSAESSTPVDELLVEYYRARERGEVQGPSEFIALHPQHADGLRAHLEGERGLLRRISSFSSLGVERPAGPKPLLAPRTFGKYDLVSEIARGGMGVVYRAREHELGRVVALKVIAAGPQASPDEVRRFRHEAEAAAALAHPNIVSILEVGEIDGQPYFTMPLLEGGSLASRIAGLRETPRVAAALLATVARAVHFAHEHGVLHRDLKPSNILFDAREEPHVVDFGLAKRIDAGASLTGTGDPLGTPRYMAPEQARCDRKAITARTDVHALGAILYEVLAGRPPFDADSSVEILRRVAEAEPERPSRIRPRTPRDLETIALKCLEKDPARRHGSALLFAAELERWLTGVPILSRPAGSLERARKWARRRPALAALILVSTLFLVGATVTSLFVAASFRSESAARGEMLRRLRYAVAMQASYEAWDGESPLDAIRLLEESLPSPGQPDLRGFEWHHLRARIHSADLRVTDAAAGVLDLSREGKRVALARSVGSDEHEIDLRDAETGAPLRSFGREHARIRHVRFSRDGRRLVVVRGEPGVAQAYDSDSGRQLWQLVSDETKTILEPSFSPDGCVLTFGRAVDPARVGRGVLAEQQGAVIVDPATGQIQTRLRFHADSVVFSPDGCRVAAVKYSDRERIRLFRFPSLAEERPLTASGAGRWHQALFIPDGTKLLARTESTIVVFDIETGNPIATPILGLFPHHTMEISPDGRRLLVGAEGGIVRMCDPTTGRLLRVLRGGPSEDLRASHLRFSSGGERVWGTWDDGPLLCWRVPSHDEPARLSREGSRQLELGFSRKENAFVVTGRDGDVTRWRVGTGGARPPEVRSIQTVDGGPRRIVTVSPDGSRAFSVQQEGPYEIWSMDRLFSNDSAAAVEAVVDAMTGDVWDAEFSNGARRLAVGSRSRKVALWERSPEGAGSPLWRRTADFEGIAERPLLSFSADERFLAVASFGSKEIRIHHPDGRRVEGRLNAGNGVSALAFAPDSQLFAAGNAVGAIRVWKFAAEASSLAPTHWMDIERHDGNVEAIGFMKDGSLVSAGVDRTLRVWDLFDTPSGGFGILRAVVRSFETKIETMRLSEDEQWLLTAGDDSRRGTAEVKLLHAERGGARP